jgi:ribose transport system ATP-binding protein
MGLAPEERKSQALFLDHQITHNITAATLRRYSRMGWLDRAGELRDARRQAQSLDMRPADPSRLARTLSGGNQQKAVLARWLLKGCRLLLLDEPTRGVDVGAKGEIHKLIDGLAQQGLGILVISSDLPEILALSDRILVISEGRLMGELPGDSSSEDVLGLAVGSSDVALSGAPSR